MPSHVPFTPRRALTAGATLLAALGLAGCAWSAGPTAAGPGTGSSSTAGPPSSAQPTPTDGTTLDIALPASVTSLELTDQDGHRVSLASLRGKTVVLTDFLSLCQEVCPLTSANFGAIQRSVDRAGLSADVRLVEITVDPQRDVPVRLAAYQKLYGAEPNWSFLTGTPSQIAALWKAFGVDYARVAEGPGPLPTDWWTGKPLHYDVAHQDVVFVLGPDGHERWLTQGSPDTEGAKPPQPLLGFLDDDGRKNLDSPEQPAWTPEQVEQAVAYVTGKPIP